MVKRLASLVVVLALGGNVMAGIPMRSGGSESGMMDCCKKALERNNSPHVSAARLCCAMNCNEPGSTSGNTSPSFSQAGDELSPSISAALPTVLIPRQLWTNYAQAASLRSKQTYILNLALLI